MPSMAEPYGRIRRALLNKPGVFSRQTMARHTGHVAGEAFSAPQVIGPLTEPLVELLEPGTIVVGMRFVPGAFPAVAGRPASEVVGLALDAEELWGRSAAALAEAVGTAASPQDALAAVQLHVHERASAGQPQIGRASCRERE